MKEVFIVSVKPTPIGGFMGNLSHLTATQLGATAIRGTYESIQLVPEMIDSVYMGNVLAANLGQSPARQASVFGGPKYDTDCTTVIVCAAGMKAVMMGCTTNSIGFRKYSYDWWYGKMSNVPHYVNLRKTNKLGNETFIDGLLKDGLSDVYHQIDMGHKLQNECKKV